MLVLSSPSGAGKTTISRRLLDLDDNLSLSISLTTRPPRPGEEAGRDYIFVDEKAFQDMVGRDELLEHAHVFGHYYGTPRAPVEEALAAGRDVLFDIDWQGTQQMADRAREDLVTVFILPPSTDGQHPTALPLPKPAGRATPRCQRARLGDRPSLLEAS